jgi:hypothetical protein
MEFFAAFAGGFGGVWFALFVLLFIVAGVFASEYDSFFGGTITFAVGLIGLDLLFGVPILETIVANPISLLVFLALYVAAGSAYAGLWRWVRYIKKHSYEIDEGYRRWAKDASKSGEPTDFDSYLESNDYRYKASRHKDKLASWVLMWPFGLLWDLMHRPARWLWNTVYDNLGVMFDRIGKQTARNIHGKKK